MNKWGQYMPVDLAADTPAALAYIGMELPAGWEVVPGAMLDVTEVTDHLTGSVVALVIVEVRSGAVGGGTRTAGEVTK